MMESKNYWEWADIDTPLEERRKYGVGDIFENSARCKKCGDYIRSNSKRDFKKCKCENVSVDGGSWNAHRMYKDSKKAKSVIIYYKDVKK